MNEINSQLRPRVKMTQAEFDEWKEVFDDYEFFSDAFSKGVTVERHTKLFKKLYSTNHGDLSSREIEVKFATLWANYNPDNPEETIEIVPTMKWFVRSKNRDDDGDFEFISGIETPDAWGYSKHHNGVNDPRACVYAFETKEEAKKWENPLTEAVQLPVEDE